jgi:hypothetical protein
MKLADLIRAAIEAGQRVTGIVAEPDGTIRLDLTPGGSEPPMDALSEARAARARKGQRHENCNEAAG